ncbi:DUF748 domain-containing protein [Desulfocastanea catecholica]
MTETNKKPFRVRRWMKISGGVVVALALLLVLLPFGVKYYLADLLIKSGADAVTIEKLRYNPFAGKIYLGGLDVQRGGQSIMHNASMVLDMRLIALLKRNVQVKRAEYHNVFIDLEQYEDGSWRFGSFTMKGQEPENAEELGKEMASTWHFLADHVILSESRVHLKTPELDLTLVIDEAELARLSTRQDHPAGSFTFKGQLNDGPIALQLDTVQLVPQLRIGGNISVAGFQLKEIAKLLGDVLPTLAGEVALDGKLLFSQGAETGIETNYDGTFGLTAPDLGNSDFTATAENFTWKGKIHYAAAAKSPQEITTDGLLAARALNLRNPASGLVVEKTTIEVSGKTTLTLAENILLEHDGRLLLNNVDLQAPPYGIVEESLSYKGIVQYDSNHKQEGLLVHADGALDLAAFQVDGGEPSTPFAAQGKSLSWQGAVDFSQRDSGKKSVLAFDGTLLGGGLQQTLPEPALRLAQEKVELKSKTAITLGEPLDIQGLSSLGLTKFALFEGKNGEPSLSFDELSLVELEGRGGNTIAWQELVATGVQAAVAGNFPLHIAVPEVRLADFFTEDLAAYKLSELQVKNPLITAVHNDTELVRLDDLTVSTLAIDATARLEAEKVQLENFAFLAAKDDAAQKTAVSFRDATLNVVSWSGDAGFQGDTLHFDDLVAIVVRDKQGNINISQQMVEMQQPGAQSGAPVTKPAAPAAAGKESPSAPFALKKIIVAGNSSVLFEDYTLAVPYKTDLNITRLEVTGVDSSRPDEKTEIVFQGELEKRAPLEVTGHIFPFKAKPAVDMKLDLKNYPLSSLSAYTVQSVGTALASGQLQVKSSIALADDKLKMKNNILLKKLETKTIAPELAAELNNQLPIPLDAALSLLRDNKRNITLDVPLSGPVSELNVGISDVLITALSKAIVPAASGYLMYALGPYGALAYVGMKVGENMLQVKLPPVVFAQQETTLTDEHIKYLERIGKILQDRPDTDMQICPRVASWEFLTEKKKTAVKGEVVAVDEEKKNDLLHLGQQRAEAIQNLLKEKYDIAHNRLLICDTAIDTKKDAIPAVLLQM